MKWVGVLPYAYKPFFDDCVETMNDSFKKNILFIDNTDPETNFGIMRSHNMGIDFMRQRKANWLVVISAAVRFGKPGGMDFIKVLEDHQDHYVIHAATSNVKGGLQQKEAGKHQRNGVFGWHLTAFHKDVFDSIGRWDENFTPYGFDDVDLSIRIQHHFKGKPGWDTFPVDVTDTVMGHSINLAKVKSPSAPRIAYFAEKWGRHPGAYQLGEYDRPFNNPKNSLAYWPPANGANWND